MKFKKTLALALSALMLMSSAVVATSAASDDSEAVGAYSNQTFLETEANNAYNEQNLGATYSAASTTFKMWSPKASSVKVKLYKTGSDKESGAGVINEYAMTPNSTTGVWSLTLPGDHKNQYYTYLVTVNGTTNETQDIYSKAVGVNGKRSMIVDLDSTDPDGWSTDKHVLLNNAQEAVVWEVHVRDFSIAANSGVSEDNKGGYLAFTEGGTKLNGDANGISTCVDYLVEQGINCVQLQPVYDFESVDEEAGASSTNRNWGYDPMNYNVPEGSYSTNPFDGNVRIKEFKQMVQALHDRGISVVMDVVYNHTYATEGSCFNKSVPGYYYRMKSNTQFSNGSGCGNETASDKKMFRKYMIESCRYWVDEYHIDGFRYDLMGLHDVDTMNQIRNNLDQVSSKILMYGEPWAAEWNSTYTECGLCPKSSIANRITQLNSRVGMFNDKYRDAIKGDTDNAGKGFVQGTTSSNTATIVSGVKGKNYSAQSPAQTVAYADAHDNLILWDKILKSNGSSSYSATSESSTEKYRTQVREVMALLMTSQGIPFMTAGSEFGRTKKGNANSYNANDSINQIESTKVSCNVIQSGTGAIAVNDIERADHGKALVIGFNVSPESGVNALARHDGVRVQTFRIIYELIDFVKQEMLALLPVEHKEVVRGHAQVKQVFDLGKEGVVAGSLVLDGFVTSKGQIRVVRRGKLLHTGPVSTIRHFKETVEEVRQAQECGIMLEGFREFEEGDMLECFAFEELPKSL